MISEESKNYESLTGTEASSQVDGEYSQTVGDSIYSTTTAGDYSSTQGDQNENIYYVKQGPDVDFGDLLDYWPNFKMDEVITKVGDGGAYQKGILIAAAFCLFACAFTSYTIGFTVSDPITKCL